MLNSRLSGQNNVVEVHPDTKGPVTITGAGDNNRIVIESSRRLGPIEIEIAGDGNTILVSGRCRIGHLRIKASDGATISIGNRTSIERAYILATDGRTVSLGRDCMISFQVQIRTTDAHGIYDVETGKRLNDAGDIHIDDHVWLGQSAIISKNTRIGPNCVVGAMAFLQNHDFEKGSVIAGVPARTIRTGVIWDRRNAPAITSEPEAMDPEFHQWLSLA